MTKYITDSILLLLACLPIFPVIGPQLSALPQLGQVQVHSTLIQISAKHVSDVMWIFFRGGYISYHTPLSVYEGWVSLGSPHLRYLEHGLVCDSNTASHSQLCSEL